MPFVHYRDIVPKIGLFVGAKTRSGFQFNPGQRFISPYVHSADIVLCGSKTDRDLKFKGRKN